jgi:hypothetical protein
VVELVELVELVKLVPASMVIDEILPLVRGAIGITPRLHHLLRLRLQLV